MPQAEHKAARGISAIYHASQLVPALLILVWLVGTFTLSGAQIAYNKRPIFDVIVPFPLFVVPVWLSFTLAGIGLLLVIPLVATTKVEKAPRLTGAFSFTAAAGIANLLFALTARDPGERPYAYNAPDPALGIHWYATIAAGLCIIVIPIRMIQVNSKYDQLRLAGKLPNGHW